jgi:hypothetical protein
MAGNLLSQFTDATSTDAVILDLNTVPHTLITEYVSFPSLLPVLFCKDKVLTAAPGSVCLDANSKIDFKAHNCFVLAFGDLTPDRRPAWTTTLVKCEYFFMANVQQAIAMNLSLPISELIMGGRNSVLIAPDYNPETKEVLDVLFATPKGHTYGYVKQICYTPSELRGKFHSCMYKCWQQMQAVRHQAPPAQNMPLHPELPPNADNQVWQHWLKEK